MLHEVTVSGEDKIIDGMLARAYRRDGSDVPYFDHGLQSAGPRHNLRPRCRL
jgi:hypothetical protein